MPRHATKTSFKSGDQHVAWIGGTKDYWHREARKLTKCPKGLIVHHIDGNYKNNDINNLKIMTQSEHVALHNIYRKGQIKKNSKIRQSIKQVLSLKKQGLTRKEISNCLNVSFRTVKRCLSTEWRCQYEN